MHSKIKDSKSKQKIDLTRSAQNLCYLLQPSEHQGMQSLRDTVDSTGIDPIETVYDRQFDEKNNTYFLKTKHNQLKKNNVYLPHYRSPYSNKYYPVIDQKQGIYPSPLIRNIQEKGLIMFSQYTKLYYGLENCINNFFVEQNQQDFCFAFYVQKKHEGNQQDFNGIWSSTNIAEIKGDPSKNIGYKVTTSVIYELKYFDDDKNESIISGNIKKIKNDNKRPPTDIEIDEFHLTMIGRMIQENQTFLRQQIQSIFIRKTQQIVDKTRIAQSNKALQDRKKFNKNLFDSQAAVKKQ